MSHLLRRTILGIALAVIVYATWVLYSGAAKLSDTLALLDRRVIVWALVFSSVNYLLRFLKWELCLKWLHVRPGDGQHTPVALGYRNSLLIYLAGLSMSVTPGKVGEVLRSSLLKSSHDVPFARTAPIVVADRLTDLIALVVLSSVGLSLAPETLPWLVVTLVLVAVGVAILGSPRFLHRILDRLIPASPGPWANIISRIRLMVDSSAELLRLRRLGLLTLISIVGWGLECLGYFVILGGFPGVEADPERSTFLWASTTLIGAVSFLPGGLGATEYSLGLLAQRLVPGVQQSIALASTLLIRGCTLWYGELIGAICLGVLMRDPRMRKNSDAARDHTAHGAQGDRTTDPTSR